MLIVDFVGAMRGFRVLRQLISVAMPADSRREKKFEIVFEIVFESAGAKPWKMAGEKLLGTYTVVLQEGLRGTEKIRNASLFTKYLFTIFAPLNPPPSQPAKVMDFLSNFY